ncbi:coenzyme F420-dependent N5,N10-methylene tetrahydromethanopterin reductase [Aquitalea magnusonii]|uniref:Coenzyme F420-dependent N5,N10-methylene tetrahydromethanopterin reductase n=1 Tax=Aquitalea magnusonii TaxID=332411 RepID=A0A3G9GEQ9_9NEIS|nr:LLM class flavin-dependent oxidoreductase [Aquitalea magnusonii]BBF85139.1 coenzyme F420-dependent N5,N10-methylene tetrahydromethanopterin reductase [Aquitalea magnusonii]
MAKKQILLNAFNMNCVGHINHGLWTHPRDNSVDYNTLGYWTELAKTLERGLFDGLFIADIIGVYDVYQQSIDLTAREAIQLPVNDPLLLVPAMAAVTQHLGFGVTSNLSYEPPYLFARRMSTLDHLTAGRAGWNIVTGYLDSGARAMGLQAQDAHDQRYDRADDYLELLYKLWEGSWEDEAVRRDKAARVFADVSRIHRISHQGPFYQLDGYHLCEPSRQRTPVLFQAGSSDRGQQFAARHAEGIFIAAQDKDKTRQLVADIRRQAVAAGRRAEDVKIFIGIAAVVGQTQAEAQEKFDDYWQYASAEAGLAHFASSIGVDFSRYGLDDPIEYGGSNAIQSAAKTAAANQLTRRKLLERFRLGSRYPTLVGDAASVADELESWVNEVGVDGFNLSRTVTPESYEDFIDLVIPELQNRGSYKTAYAEGSLRHKLFAEGDRLPARHAAAGYRPR